MQRIFLTLLLLLFLAQLAWADHFTGKLFVLHTDSFSNQGLFPTVYTCDGKDISPELHWNNAPISAKSFVIILKDPNAPRGTFYHWILYNIPATYNKLHKNFSAQAEHIPIGVNSFGKQSYNGPCPPEGSTHAYIFTLYALDTVLDLTGQVDAPTLLKAIDKHIIDKEDLITIYGR